MQKWLIFGKTEKSMNWKILHVKGSDWSNQAVSEIDSEVKIFVFFEHSRPMDGVHSVLLQLASSIFPSPKRTSRTPWSIFENFLTKEILYYVIDSPLPIIKK